METLGNQNPAFPAFKYFCNFCHYGTSKKNHYTEHLSTAKHKKHAFGNKMETFGNVNPTNFVCNICMKDFKHRSGLWKHNKVCKIELENNNKNFEITNDVIMNILKQNSEFQQMLLEQNKTIIELSKNSQITNNTINSHNKSFNLQLFLNETCKNAMNISEFIDSLQLQLSDLENVGEVGYIEGISNIIVKNLNALDVTLRPVHCTDKK